MFDINGRQISQARPPYIIAELSANHNGSIDRALDTITAARDCGADAIKLQTYTPDTMTIDCDKADFQIKGGLWNGYSLYNLYEWAHTPFDWFEQLFEHAAKVGITAFSTPFDETAVDLLARLNAPAFKVASFEVTDVQLIAAIAQQGKPMIISTGMASYEEIKLALQTARENGAKNIVLLHCISSYPAPMSVANLAQMVNLKDQFDGVTIGLSDHTLGTTASVAAVALGACVIEKHFTLSRRDKGPDSEFSLEPDELTRLCRDTRDAWETIGSAGFQRPEIEKKNTIFRRSIYFVKDLPAGHVLQVGDIRRIRPGHGLPPIHFDNLIGKKLRVGVGRGDPTTWSCFED